MASTTGDSKRRCITTLITATIAEDATIASKRQRLSRRAGTGVMALADAVRVKAQFGPRPFEPKREKTRNKLAKVRTVR